MRRSRALPVLGVALATPVGVKVLRPCREPQSTPSGLNLGAYQMLTLLSSDRLAIGCQVAAALLRVPIYPSRSGPLIVSVEFCGSMRRSRALSVLDTASALAVGVKALRYLRPGPMVMSFSISGFGLLLIAFARGWREGALKDQTNSNAGKRRSRHIAGAAAVGRLFFQPIVFLTIPSSLSGSKGLAT